MKTSPIIVCCIMTTRLLTFRVEQTSRVVSPREPNSQTFIAEMGPDYI